MSLRRALFAFAAVIATLTAPTAFAMTALTPGTPLRIDPFGAYSLVTNAYIDVDASAKQLTVNVTGSGGDVDLFLRYGSPFPDTANCSTAAGAPPCLSYDMIQRYAQYHSMSASSNESIVVTNASTIPLTAGRWYITVINGSNSSATATLTATPSATVSSANFTLDFGHSSTNASDATQNCDIAPWSDTTPATVATGNPGTTLGDQRKYALQYAVQQLAAQLNSPVPITVHACWAPMGGTATRATLAHASSTSLAFSDTDFAMPWLAKKYTWYTNTQIARMGGTSPCGALGGDCSSADQSYGNVVEITFNSDIGSSGVLGGSPFYFGYTPDPNSNSSDFIAIAMHEITHGLGFLGLANTDPSAGPIGARAGITNGATTVTYQNYDLGPWDDIFGDSVVNVGSDQSYTPFFGYEVNSQPNNQARATAMTSGNTVTTSSTGTRFAPTLLRWSDPLAVNSDANQLKGVATPGNFPSLYAPCDLTKTTTCSTSVGSTLSHTVQQGDLMNAYYNANQVRTMGLAAPMLAAMGWSTAPAPAATFARPFTGIWYDRAHSGHGLDFRFVGHDELGDNYFLIFYTYDQTGAIEIFQSQGHVVDGVYVPIIIGQDGSTLVRMQYDPVAKKATPVAFTGGSIVVDFNQAANSPACRALDRSADVKAGLLLGVLSWKFVDQSSPPKTLEQGDWCIQPLTNLAQNASPDFGGLYYGGRDDSGWGFSVLDVNRGSYNQVALDFYFGDASGKPVWAVANTGDQPFVNGQPIPLYQNAAGYCRACAPKPQNPQQIGTITLNFGTPSTVSIHANLPGGSFDRNNVQIYNLGVAQQP
ncbi:MAG: hypothetical protein JSS42_00370 [Proteobacteria bacterium]|nr:hypothetical protein [Pseudomonadota bacterium]